VVSFPLIFAPKFYTHGGHVGSFKNQLTYSVVQAVVEGVDH
jgi:hypothetical protein